MKEQICVKCGHDNQIFEYRYNRTYAPEGSYLKEWLDLTCTQCGWEWHIDCLDSPRSSET